MTAEFAGPSNWCFEPTRKKNVVEWRPKPAMQTWKHAKHLEAIGDVHTSYSTVNFLSRCFLFIHPLFLPFFNHPFISAMNPRFQGLDNVQRLTLPSAAGPLHLRGLPSNPRSARAIVVHKDSSILQAFGLTSELGLQRLQVLGNLGWSLIFLKWGEYNYNIAYGRLW